MTRTSAHPVSIAMVFRVDPKAPPGKLADADLIFDGGLLHGLTLRGFAVWERRGGGRNVTMPSRPYSVNGERRSFALLRAISDPTALEPLRDWILETYAEWEREAQPS